MFVCFSRWYDADVKQADHGVGWLGHTAGGDGAEGSHVQQHRHKEAGEAVLRGLIELPFAFSRMYIRSSETKLTREVHRPCGFYVRRGTAELLDSLDYCS